MKFELPKLDYEYDALDPHIDARTMEIHHTKHHQGYTDKFNAALEGKNIEGSAEEIISKIKDLPEDIRTAVRNNGGGYVNHALFWKILSPEGGGDPDDEELIEAINKNFGSFSEFREKFSAAAKTRFGSGWAWLCVKDDNSLCVCSTPNQDNPMMDIAQCPGMPILGLDVWEHAYYLKYQNKRPDYVEAFWNVVNWKEVARRYKDAIA